MKPIKIVVVSGLSGSGKSHALNCLEDLGFFCVDNLPPALLPVFAELCEQSTSEIEKTAIGIDIRERGFLNDFLVESERLRQRGSSMELLFLEAEDEVLVRRFSESRRPHPLAKNRTVIEGIQAERLQLAELRKRADQIIDTSDLTVHQLKDTLVRYHKERDKSRPFPISIISFGYKHGVPYEVDLVFDVRFLPNPNFVPELKALTGQDRNVADFVMKAAESSEYFKRLTSFLDYLVPQFDREGRSYLTIGIGCTGGRHRSVAIANALAEHLISKSYDAKARHRDVER